MSMHTASRQRTHIESTIEDRPASGHGLIHVTTGTRTEFIDLTDRLASFVARSDVATGLLNIQTLHTTTAIVLNEREPLLEGDFEGTFERIAPLHACYQHDRFDRRTHVAPDERVNGHAHCRALLLSAAVCLNVVDGRLVLGSWQRVLFAELDGPRQRTVSLVLVGHPQRRAADAIAGSERPRLTAHASCTERRFQEALG
jgi:secondary thiamine-phosphate synthase enzyme